jgi:hypothetical protein
MYWRTDGGFASDAKAFAVQPSPGTGPDAPCNANTSDYTFYTFSAWQQTVAEDAQSVVQNPGFRNPAYPADDYSLPKGSPGAGFVVFDPNQAGRLNPEGPFADRSPEAGHSAVDVRDDWYATPPLNPPAIPATFPTKPFNPAIDY